MKPILGLDTETYRGKAFILQTPETVIPIRRFRDFVSFIVNSGYTNFVFFNIDYDVSALLKHLPTYVAANLYLEKAVKVLGCEMRYFPGKYFRLRFHGKSYNFYDLYPFFQCSLDFAGKKFLGIRKRKISKNLLSNLTPQRYRRHKTVIDAYGRHDAYITQKLGELLLEAFKSAGIKHKHLYSPGNIAKNFWRSTGIKDIAPQGECAEFIAKGYYGARIEVLRRGFFSDLVIDDIKSAYPAAMSHLPNFAKAVYKFSDKIESPYFFAEVKVFDKPGHFHLLPYRTEENVLIFPRYSGQTTVISCFEHDLYKRLNLGKLQIVRVCNIFVGKNLPYRKHINKLFAGRKESALKSLAFKLVLNSSYGIKAEKISDIEAVSFFRGYRQRLSVYERTLADNFKILLSRKCAHALRFWEKACNCRYCKAASKISRKRYWRGENLFEYGNRFFYSRSKPGKHSNLAIAALITAYVRCQVFLRMRRHPKTVVGVFTDSLLYTGKPDAQTSSKLGKWERKYIGKSFVIGAGIYETRDETKTRGFRWKKKLSGLLRKSRGTSIHIPQNMRVSIGQVVRQGVEDFNFNEILSSSRTIDLNFDTKRIWERDFLNGRDVLTNSITSNPISLTNIGES